MQDNDIKNIFRGSVIGLSIVGIGWLTAQSYKAFVYSASSTPKFMMPLLTVLATVITYEASELLRKGPWEVQKPIIFGLLASLALVGGSLLWPDGAKHQTEIEALSFPFTVPDLDAG